MYKRVQKKPTFKVLKVQCILQGLFNGCNFLTFSEHSRHWFFRGRLVVDGDEMDGSLFQMIMATQQHSNDNNIITFNDNSRLV